MCSVVICNVANRAIIISMERVIILVDMDCFYVQVEQRLNPSVKDKPCAVVQYKKRGLEFVFKDY